ncbi:MAG TPA: peptidoglycan-associated lipoprotein [Alphaproteobacteria bacterium]|nr:peptidoglycan-associated lipoprotein [Alphaproteobacteria bacterium]
MMKKNLLVTASVLVLAACANNSQDVDLTEQNLEIQPSVQQDAYQQTNKVEEGEGFNMAVSYDGIDASILDEKTLQLRQDLASITTNKVLFGFDSSAVDETAKADLTLIANFVLANDSIASIIIQGHADERGTREYNLALGERRAVAVKKYLVGLGLNAEQIETISFGKEQPEDPSHNSAAWNKNRRAVILLGSAE